MLRLRSITGTGETATLLRNVVAVHIAAAVFRSESPSMMSNRSVASSASRFLPALLYLPASSVPGGHSRQTWVRGGPVSANEKGPSPFGDGP